MPAGCDGILLLAGAAAQHAQRDHSAHSTDHAHKEQHGTESGCQRHCHQHWSAHTLALLLPVWDNKVFQVRLQVLEVLACDALIIIKLKGL